jgi:hypothetical protein
MNMLVAAFRPSLSSSENFGFVLPDRRFACPLRCLQIFLPAIPRLQGDFREMQGQPVFYLAENLSDPKA